ncbi:MAG: GDP-mannose 4,6-dehydratase, partial [Lachnospiraceae bacterium]|nr:GDP-mannose 4,6-dehydratase [Lachnospiraceae bacterium]
KVFGTDYDTPDGSCVRDYIHVTDLASAHLLALRYLENGGDSDFFNLGNAKGTSVIEVVEAVRRVTGKDFKVIYADRRPGDPAILVGSSEKAQRILGWIPKYGDIDTIVQHAWKWHENRGY